MARVSERAKAYTKGKAEKGYWGDETLKDILWDIYRTHKSWGDEWYGAVRKGSYVTAKAILAIVGTGEYRNKALDIIDELLERSTTYTVMCYNAVTNALLTTDIFHSFDEAYVFAKAMAGNRRFEITLEEPDGSTIRF